MTSPCQHRCDRGNLAASGAVAYLHRTTVSREFDAPPDAVRRDTTTFIARPNDTYGRDAKVTCKVTGARGSQNVACTVKVAGKSAGRVPTHADARLVRDGRTYAAGTTTHLRARRTVARGDYVLRLSAGERTWKIPVHVG